MNRRLSPIRWLLAMFILVAGVSCGSVADGLIKPQPGEWTASLKFKTAAGDDNTWILTFTVSEDGKQVTNAQVVHYFGELTSDTQVTVLMSPRGGEIEDNSFSLSFTDFSGYTSNTRTFKGTFTSSAQVTGTLTVAGTIHNWTAAPAAP